MSKPLLNIGTSGLMAAKKSLETTSHNISNVNTEGFSRQRVETEAYHPMRRGNAIVGRGVDIKTVKRIHDDMLEKRLIKSQSETSFSEEKAHQLGQLEQIFNEIDGNGLNQLMNDLFNSFRELSNQPENDTLREIVRDKAHLIVKDFKRIDQRLADLNGNMDAKIKLHVADINSLTKQIGHLNIQIRKMEMNDNAVAGDLRDARDLAIKQLSEFFELNTYTDERGRFTVDAYGLGTLVVSGTNMELQAEVIKKSDDINEPGEMQVFFKGRPAVSLNKKFSLGKMGGIISAKEGELSKLGEKIDEIAFHMAHSVNAIHRRGYINKMLPTDDQGMPYNDGTYKQITDIDFFGAPTEMKYAARNIQLSKLIRESPDYIATALSANAPADNRIALAISKLEQEKVVSDGSATFEEEYLKVVGGVGLATSKSRVNAEHSKGILAQMQSMRERISGVSLDEEAANLVKYQHMYQASAKVIQASEEAFDAILRIMG